MTTLLVTHPASLDHVTPPGHPERVARYQAIMEALSDSAFDGLTRQEAPICDRAEILRCHPEAYVAAIEAAIPDTGYRSLDADTHVSSGSLEAAQRAVGGCVEAADAVMAGEAKNAFASFQSRSCVPFP